MHRHDAEQRQFVIEDAEHRLLHLAGIGGAADEDQFFGKVDGDDGFRPAAMPRGIGAEAGQINDCKLGHERREFRHVGTDQQRADEQAVPRKFGDDANVDAVFGLRSAEQILRVKPILRRDCC